MTSSAIWWLFFNVLSIVLLAFYSMMEMACVSFNRVRLHYYVHKGERRARWLNYLLQHPFRMFGTTLIGVNVSLVVGSECAREFHSAVGLNPDLAPLTQVIIVVIFGELAPMFAARQYAEHVAMLGVPIIYASARLLAPALWIIGGITDLANILFKGKPGHGEIFLSQEELQNILDEQSDAPPSDDSEEFNVISRNIFKLRHKTAKDILTPLNQVPKLSSNSTVLQMKDIVSQTDADFAAVYYKNHYNIVGMVFIRDLTRVPDTKRVRDYARPPWFVTENTPLTQILQQFQTNSQTVAIILDAKGNSVGALTLDDLLLEIFGEASRKPIKEKSLLFIERTFSGETLVRDFNEQFDIILGPDENQTLSELMIATLGHIPEEDESIYIEPFELTAKETSLMEVKSIVVKSVMT